MKLALFLGAGASVPYGMPTTKELRKKIDARDLDFPRRDLLDSSEFPDIEHVLSALDELGNFVHSRAGKLYAKFDADADANGEEEPVGHVGASRASRERGENEHIDGRFESYVEDSRDSKEIIERLITQNYKWDPSHDESAGKILRPLFDLARSKEGSITVFTTNYDTVIEEYCANSDRRIELVDGFQFHTAMRAMVWSGKFAPRGDNPPTKLFLYKLHGSMNWLAGGTAGRQLILQKPDTGASDDRARDMYIRPSLDTKSEATQREPYATILREFNRLLPLFDACIVIGYSFRDPHISKRLVKFAKAGKTLVVLSPTAVADFKKNALGEKLSFDEDGWGGYSPSQIKIKSDGNQRHVRIVNERLDKNNIDRVIVELRSATSGDFPDSEADAAMAGTF